MSVQVAEWVMRRALASAADWNREPAWGRFSLIPSGGCDMKRATRFLGALAVLACAGLAGCGGSKAAADCMTAMSEVNCPPGTRPEAASEGQDSFSGQADARTYRAEASGGSSANCDYICIPYCDCGIQSIGGDGSVQCVPCN